MSKAQPGIIPEIVQLGNIIFSSLPGQEVCSTWFNLYGQSLGVRKIKIKIKKIIPGQARMYVVVGIGPNLPGR